MKFIPVLIFLLAFKLNVNAQEKTFTDSAIAEILNKSCIKIGEKLVEAAKQGKIKAYRTDSLNATISLEDLNNKAFGGSNSKNVNGLQVFYKLNGELENTNQNMQLAGIAPLYNPTISGIELPQQPMYFLAFADMEKIVSPEDKKLIIILSKLLFAAGDVYNHFSVSSDEERQKQEIDNFIINQVESNINLRPLHVFLTQENLKPLASQLVHKTAEIYFEYITTYKNRRPEYNFTNIYEDAQLKNQYTSKRWQELNQFCETVTIAVGPDAHNFIDSTVCTEYDYYAIDEIIISPVAFGLGQDEPAEYGNRKIRVFTQRKNPMIVLPSWLSFIINTYLN